MNLQDKILEFIGQLEPGAPATPKQMSEFVYGAKNVREDPSLTSKLRPILRSMEKLGSITTRHISGTRAAVYTITGLTGADEPDADEAPANIVDEVRAAAKEYFWQSKGNDSLREFIDWVEKINGKGGDEDGHQSDIQG